MMTVRRRCILALGVFLLVCLPALAHAQTGAASTIIAPRVVELGFKFYF